MEKKLILITNDDSVNAPGIHFLVDCVKDMGEVWVVAPAEPKSGQSSSLTFNAPLRIEEIAGYEGARLFTVSGTPVDCVKMAMHAILCQGGAEVDGGGGFSHPAFLIGDSYDFTHDANVYYGCKVTTKIRYSAFYIMLKAP